MANNSTSASPAVEIERVCWGQDMHAVLVLVRQEPPDLGDAEAVASLIKAAFESTGEPLRADLLMIMAPDWEVTSAFVAGARSVRGPNSGRVFNALGLYHPKTKEPFCVESTSQSSLPVGAILENAPYFTCR